MLGPLVSTTLVLILAASGEPEKVRIAAFGDQGAGPGKAKQEQVARALDQIAATEPLNFVLLLGDNFYPKGVVSVDDPQWAATFEQMYDLPHLNVPFVATLGNHDHLGNAQAEIDYGSRKKRWVMEPFPYRFSWPRDSKTPLVDCFAIDTSPVAEAGADPGPQLNALESLLTASKARWKIVFGHHPIFSDGTHGDMPALAPFRKLFVEKGVDAYLAGHDHDLEFLTARDRAAADRIAYLISGGGGYTVYPCKKSEVASFAASNFGFLVLDATPDALRARFYGLDKGVLYDRTWKKGETPAASAPAAPPQPADSGSKKTGALDRSPSPPAASLTRSGFTPILPRLAARRPSRGARFRASSTPLDSAETSMRIDGRTNDETRPIRLTRNFTKYAPGSVLVEMGDTKVLCTATLEMQVPQFLIGTGQGWLSAEYSMLPGSTATRKAREGRRGMIDGRTQEIQRLIGRALRAIVDLKQIGERTIWLDCDVIQADGSTRTASINGAFVAFADCVRKALSSKAARNLIASNVAAVSVGRVGGETMLDLNYDEDLRADVDMTVVLTGRGQFVEIQGTAEKNPFTDGELTEMLVLARKGVSEIIEAQNRSLREI